MNDYRMTSDPTAAATFAEGQERDLAMAFARDYKTANLHDMPERVQGSTYGIGLVHLPTFMGDLWVAKN